MITEIGDNLFEKDGKFRIERGPKLKMDVATEELLSNDVTADHYQAPKTVTVDGVEVEIFSRDAMGDPIRLGQEMIYLDWLGEYTWYSYKLERLPVVDSTGMPVLENGKPLLREVWTKLEGSFDGDTAEAIAHLETL